MEVIHLKQVGKHCHVSRMILQKHRPCYEWKPACALFLLRPRPLPSLYCLHILFSRSSYTILVWRLQWERCLSFGLKGKENQFEPHAYSLSCLSRLSATYKELPPFPSHVTLVKKVNRRIASNRKCRDSSGFYFDWQFHLKMIMMQLKWSFLWKVLIQGLSWQTYPGALQPGEIRTNR